MRPAASVPGNRLRSTLAPSALAASTVLVAACVALGFLAYNRRTAQRVIVAADTVVGYGPRPFRLDAQATRNDGHTAARARLRFEGHSSAGIVSDDGTARCTGAGTILTTVRAASATSKIVVICRPLRWISGLMPMVGWGSPSDAPLYVGGPAQRLEVRAYDVAGLPVERLSARESVRDSSIARLDRGLCPLERRRDAQLEPRPRMVRGLAQRRSCNHDDWWPLARSPKRKLRSRKREHAATLLRRRR
jgi:hypothetical protein